MAIQKTSSQKNPYNAPSSLETPRSLTKGSLDGYRKLSPLFAISGSICGLLAGVIGYPVLTGLFDVLLTPPLVPPANYGQFFFIVFGVAVYMTFLGLLAGLIPFLSWKIILPINLICIAAIVWFNSGLFVSVNWLEAPIAAMLVLFLLPAYLSMIADVWIRPKSSREQ